MTIQPKPLSEITQQAMSVLSKELGVANTLRFIGQFTSGYGNYTKERRELYADMSLDDIFSEMKAARQESG
jgi:hypothetical protein